MESGKRAIAGEGPFPVACWISRRAKCRLSDPQRGGVALPVMPGLAHRLRGRVFEDLEHFPDLSDQLAAKLALTRVYDPGCAPRLRG